MQKIGYALVRDQFGNPRFDDGTGKTPGQIWDEMPADAKEGYRGVMTDAEKAKFTMEGYNADA